MKERLQNIESKLADITNAIEQEQNGCQDVRAMLNEIAELIRQKNLDKSNEDLVDLREKILSIDHRISDKWLPLFKASHSRIESSLNEAKADIKTILAKP